MAAVDERDPGRVRGPRARGGGRPGAPEPHHPAGEAQGVEPARVVGAQAGREDRVLPHRGRGLEAFELFDDREQAGRAFPPVVEAVPGEEEPHVVGGLDGVDLPAEPGERIAVDAGEEAPLAPFRFGRRRAVRTRRGRRGAGRCGRRERRGGRAGEVAAEHEPFALQGGERGPHRSRVHPEVRGEGRGGDRPEPSETPADQLPQRLFR